jgi:SAM-dependent methyltransferase
MLTKRLKERRVHMKESVRTTFDELASIYEQSVDTDSLYNSEYERPAMLDLLPSNLQGKAVLDAGCAAGWYTQQLIDRGANVVAGDISMEMINAAKRRVGEKADVVCLDLEAVLPFKDQSFDFIVSSLTLHYIKDWQQPFNEFHRILKPEGCILFSVHHPLTDIKLLKDPKYFSTELIVDHWKKQGKTFEVPFYRRPLHDILNMTLSYFSLEEVKEPTPTMRIKREAPKSYKKLMTSPQFLIIKANKKQ